MRSILPREEGVALTLLSVFGALRLDCLDYALFRICGKENNQWYLNRMVRQMKIFGDGVNYLATPKSKQDERISRCFWVIMQYIDSIDLPTMQREREPDGVSFLRNNKLYRSLIASPMAETTISLINRVASDDVNYIIIVRKEEEIEQFEELKRSHAFAIVEPYEEGQVPEVSFYTKKALKV